MRYEERKEGSSAEIAVLAVIGAPPPTLTSLASQTFVSTLTGVFTLGGFGTTKRCEGPAVP